MKFDPNQVLANARAAQTDDLLDRVTAYRAGMEPEALELFEMELHRRGVTAEQIAEHGRQQPPWLRDSSGLTLSCDCCRRPAVEERWGWHRLWGWVPLFPRRRRYCVEHRPGHAREPASP